MKFDDKGAFFTKHVDGSIWYMVYMKTNLLRKMKPEPPLYSFNTATKEFTKKRHAPNKVWFTEFDKSGRDYPSISAKVKNARRALFYLPM